MSLNFFYIPSQPVASSELPGTVMLLEDWQVVNVIGPDARKYLQGQLTVDVGILSGKEHILCGHCNATGKMWSDLRLFHNEKYFSYIIRRSVANLQIAELKKYAVFSDITITTDHKVVILGVAGLNAATILLELFFSKLPDAKRPVIKQKNSTLLYLAKPKDRYILIMSIPMARILVKALKESMKFNNSTQWVALEIEAGNPIINNANSSKLIPQATNLQALGGICFHKGCYIGQEMIAKAQYRGANHKALYWLKGTATRIPQDGENLEKKIGQKWRRMGTILAAIRMKDGSINIQAVLDKNLEEGSVFRVNDDKSSLFKIQTLPR